MKFALGSDLHLCFGSFIPENKENADCLILAGDIYEVSDLPAKTEEYHYVRTFFRECAKNFKHVIWVAGNHESYKSNLYGVRNSINKWLNDDPLLKNVVFLEKESIVIDDIHIHGTTLWTDLKKNDPIVSQIVFRGMNDFSQISDMSISQWFIEHRNSIEYLEKSIKKGKKNLVITHHHPSHLGVPEKFAGNDFNYGYFTDLSEFIYEHKEINVWCCGHIHDKSDYMLYNTRVLCNPRGYNGYESIANSYQFQYFEI